MTTATRLARLHHAIRTVPDWPKPGIQFRDITPVLQDAALFQHLLDELVARHAHDNLALVAGIEARGFILGAALAARLGVGFIPLRKPGKLPFATLSEAYSLEYGHDMLEIHVDACQPGQRVLLVDDLIATGGTLHAAATLIARLGAELVAAVAVIDLPELGGSARLRAAGIPLDVLMVFGGH